VRGSHKSPKLDDKSRFTLPSKYRGELSEQVTVVCELEHCLGVYPRQVFDAMMAPINQASPTFRRVRDYQRWMESRAEDATPDKQGRITITAQQRAWANLEHETITNGAGNRLEIWNPDDWAAYQERLLEEFADFDGDIVPKAVN
jgi:MraZ protein